MGKLVDGDDGLPVEEVGSWAKHKIESLCRYIAISRGVRSKWIAPGKAGATYIELFCGPGRSRIKKTGEIIEGSCVAAWKESVRRKTPFSSVFIGDLDSERRGFAAERLKRLGAPVHEIQGDAVAVADAVLRRLEPSGLHFAFVDPYNLGAFDFAVMNTLSRRQRMDILVHVSKMDLQRNTGLNIRSEASAFDRFAPGWRTQIDLSQTHRSIRRDVFDFWQRKVASLGMDASTDMQLIKGSKGQHLYWLTLVARHELAHAFWQVAKDTGQMKLF